MAVTVRQFSPPVQQSRISNKLAAETRYQVGYGWCSDKWTSSREGVKAVDYKLDGNVLQVTGAMSEVLDTEFDAQMNKLLDHGAREIIVDCSLVPQMSSWYLGKLADVAMEAFKQEKELKVIASPAVEKVIRLVGLERLFTLQPKDDN
jgi:anti-anti-sigma factor